jgi:predicted nucleic acid-binding protein
MILVDTNILVRLFEFNDPDCVLCNDAVSKLDLQGHELFIAPQSMAEFWNVTTRPVSARGGQGHSILEADRRLTKIERAFAILPDHVNARKLWRRLIVQHGVTGKQVHDARLAALMLTYHVKRILTFNTRDFVRYPGIAAIDPATV